MELPSQTNKRQVQHISLIDKIDDENVLKALQEIRRRNVTTSRQTRILKQRKQSEEKKDDGGSFLDPSSDSTFSTEVSSNWDGQNSTIFSSSFWMPSKGLGSSAFGADSRADFYPNDENISCSPLAAWMEQFQHYIGQCAIRLGTERKSEGTWQIPCAPEEYVRTSSLVSLAERKADDANDTKNSNDLESQQIGNNQLSVVNHAPKYTSTSSQEVRPPNDSSTLEPAKASGGYDGISENQAEMQNTAKRIVSTRLRELSQKNRNIVREDETNKAEDFKIVVEATEKVARKDGADVPATGKKEQVHEGTVIRPINHLELVPLLSLMGKVRTFLSNGTYGIPQLLSISVLLHRVDKRVSSQWEQVEQSFRKLKEDMATSSDPKVLERYASKLVDRILSTTDKYIIEVTEDGTFYDDSTYGEDTTLDDYTLFGEMTLDGTLSLNESIYLEHETTKGVLLPAIGTFLDTVEGVDEDLYNYRKEELNMTCHETHPALYKTKFASDRSGEGKFQVITVIDDSLSMASNDDSAHESSGPFHAEMPADASANPIIEDDQPSNATRSVASLAARQSSQGSVASLTGHQTPQGSVASLTGRQSPQGSVASLTEHRTPHGSVASLNGRQPPQGSAASLNGRQTSQGSVGALTSRQTPQGSVPSLVGRQSPRGSVASLTGRRSPQGSVASLAGGQSSPGSIRSLAGRQSPRGSIHSLGGSQSPRGSIRLKAGSQSSREKALTKEISEKTQRRPSIARKISRAFSFSSSHSKNGGSFSGETLTEGMDKSNRMGACDTSHQSSSVGTDKEGKSSDESLEVKSRNETKPNHVLHGASPNTMLSTSTAQSRKQVTVDLALTGGRPSTSSYGKPPIHSVKTDWIKNLKEISMKHSCGIDPHDSHHGRVAVSSKFQTGKNFSKESNTNHGVSKNLGEKDSSTHSPPLVIRHDSTEDDCSVLTELHSEMGDDGSSFGGFPVEGGSYTLTKVGSLVRREDDLEKGGSLVRRKDDLEAEKNPTHIESSAGYDEQQETPKKPGSGQRTRWTLFRKNNKK